MKKFVLFCAVMAIFSFFISSCNDLNSDPKNLLLLNSLKQEEKTGTLRLNLKSGKGNGNGSSSRTIKPSYESYGTSYVWPVNYSYTDKWKLDINAVDNSYSYSITDTIFSDDEYNYDIKIPVGKTYNISIESVDLSNSTIYRGELKNVVVAENAATLSEAIYVDLVRRHGSKVKCEFSVPVTYRSDATDIDADNFVLKMTKLPGSSFDEDPTELTASYQNSETKTYFQYDTENQNKLIFNTAEEIIDAGLYEVGLYYLNGSQEVKFMIMGDNIIESFTSSKEAAPESSVYQTTKLTADVEVFVEKNYYATRAQTSYNGLVEGYKINYKTLINELQTKDDYNLANIYFSNDENFYMINFDSMIDSAYFPVDGTKAIDIYFGKTKIYSTKNMAENGTGYIQTLYVSDYGNDNNSGNTETEMFKSFKNVANVINKGLYRSNTIEIIVKTSGSDYITQNEDFVLENIENVTIVGYGTDGGTIQTNDSFKIIVNNSVNFFTLKNIEINSDSAEDIGVISEYKRVYVSGKVKAIIKTNNVSLTTNLDEGSEIKITPADLNEVDFIVSADGGIDIADNINYFSIWDNGFYPGYVINSDYRVERVESGTVKFITLDNYQTYNVSGIRDTIEAGTVFVIKDADDPEKTMFDEKQIEGTSNWKKPLRDFFGYISLATGAEDDNKNITIDMSEFTGSISGSTWFVDCATTIILPDNCSNLYRQAFQNCTILKNIYIADSNSYYKTIDGVLYTKSGEDPECLIRLPPKNTSIYYNFPQTVDKVYDYAFRNCKKLVYVPNFKKVTLYDQYCHGVFENSTIKQIEFNDSISTITSAFFQGCTNLTTVALPSMLSEIMSLTFNGCTALATVTFRNVNPPTIYAEGSTKEFNGVPTTVQFKVPSGKWGTYVGDSIFSNTDKNALAGYLSNIVSE